MLIGMAQGKSPVRYSIRQELHAIIDELATVAVPKE